MFIVDRYFSPSGELLLSLYMHFLGPHFLEFMTNIEELTHYSIQYVQQIHIHETYLFSFWLVKLAGLMSVFWRGCPLLFQFHLSIQTAVMMEKVLNLQSFIWYVWVYNLRILLNILPPLTLKAELPLEFPDGTTPVTCRVSIYDSSTDSKVGVGSLMDKASASPLPAGSLYMEEVLVKVWLLPLSLA